MAYKKTTWVTGDVITADKMNNIEEGIASVTGADSPYSKDERDYIGTSMSQKGQNYITLRPDDFSELYADGKVLTPGSDDSIAVETTNSAWKIYKYELGRAFVLRADQVVKNDSAAGCIPIAFRYKGINYAVDYNRTGQYYLADTVLVSYNATNEAYAIEEFSFTETVRQEFSDSIICRDHAGEFDSLVVFGDSIFANTISNPDTGALTNNGNGVTKQLADLMGVPLYKHAVNNATLSTKYTDEAQNVIKQIQDYIASTDGGTTPLFVIEGGTNDAYHYGVSNLGTYGSSDTTTIYGAIYYAINLLLSIEGVQPWQILVCTPIPKGIRALWDGTTSFSSAGWLANTDLELTTIGHAMYEIALNRQCSVINGYNAIFDELSSQYICQLMMGDDTHPTVYGSERYARYIYDTLFSGASTKEVEEDIASLKSAIDEKADESVVDGIAVATVIENHETVTENIFPSLTWTDNQYMGADGVVHNGTGYRYSNKFSVSPGDTFAFANPNFGFGYITAFNGDTPIPESGQQGGKTYTVLSGTNAIVITENMSRGDAAINWTHQQTTYTNIMEERVSAVEQDIDSLEESMDVFEYTEDVSVSTVPVFTPGAVDQNGTTYASGSYLGFQYSQKISATNGSLIECLDAAGNQVKMRWVCAYKNNVAVPASGTNADVFSFNLSGDVDSVVVTCRISGNAVSVKVTTPTETKAYFANAKPIPVGFASNKGTLSDGEVLYLPKNNVKNENVLIFSANIASFGSVKIGKPSNTYVVVDANNITLHNTANPDTYIIPHGITIGHNITVMVQTETSLDASLIRVSSDGVTFDYTTPARRFVMDDGTPYAISVGSVLTDCSFAWTSKSISAPIWIFGDSYLSYWDTNWTKYLIDDGYIKNCMLNGFAGESSARDYESLVNLLAITTPKIVVWCLGMNDPDTDSAVSASWKNYYDKVVNLQKKYGFELVLYTVPTTPTMNNKYKDAIVRESGYRYIEADKAVRINDNGDWIAGALQSDNVHPSAIGGNIIYNRILTDLPEIMVNW